MNQINPLIEMTCDTIKWSGLIKITQKVFERPFFIG